MRKLLSSRRAKSIITLILLIGFVASQAKSDSVQAENGALWNSAHCFITSIWFIFTTIHVWQHWNLIKALAKRKVAVRNKITTITTIAFALMSVSILLMACGLGNHAMKFHHIIGHFYIVVILIHIISMCRKRILRAKSKRISSRRRMPTKKELQ